MERSKYARFSRWRTSATPPLLKSSSKKHVYARWPGRGNSRPVSLTKSQNRASQNGRFNFPMEAPPMKYMLLIYSDEQAWPYPERGECFEESTQLAHQLKAKGQYLAANPLQPVSTATSVQVRGGKVLVADGPFAETREH